MRIVTPSIKGGLQAMASPHGSDDVSRQSHKRAICRYSAITNQHSGR